MTKKTQSSKPYILTILDFMFFGIFIAFATFLINYTVHFENSSAELKRNAETITEIKKEQITTFISRIEQTLYSIEHSAILDNFIADPNDPTRKRILQELIRTVAIANTDFFQVRLLDTTGMEVIRIDKERNATKAHIVPDEALQDKHNRYYFKAAVQLPPNTYWHSRLDLNIEHGIIEQPLHPTYRVALPIYRQDALYALLIVNVDMRSFLMTLWSHTTFNTYLVDKEGYYIHHHNMNLSWSRYTGTERTLFDDFPEYAPKIMKQDVFNNEKIYSFGLEKQFDNGEMIKMILEPKYEFIEQQSEHIYQLVLYLALLTLAISLPMGGIFAIGPARLQVKLNNLLKENSKYIDIIDQYVVTSETDLQGKITKVSTAFCDLSGYEKEELLGANHRILNSGKTSPEVYTELWNTITEGSVWTGELLDRKKDGSSYWVKTTILPEYNNENRITCYTSVSYDITDRKKIEALSRLDPLTNLGNRAMLDEEMKNELERVARYSSNLSIIMLDIDFFKHINDTYGHLTGDAVLQKIAALLKNGIRKTDKVGRWGGEEFLILCPETTLEYAEVLAENLRKQIEAVDFGIAGDQTASFGLSSYQESDTADTILTRADNALYKAKEEGRNRVVLAGHLPSTSS
ncbi:MAG: diguanylate cyclase [Helicobacteraceae bacterium]|nr:diguanylate cyclase [Helicobacteraceae bacterium]